MNNPPSIPEQNHVDRPGFKGHSLEKNFSTKKFGKCPMHYILEEGMDKTLPTLILNPKEQWNSSPVEALQSAFKQLTSTDDRELAKEIIDRAVLAMPATHGKEHNTNVIYQSLSDFEPKDSLEAKLCAQCTSLYAQGMAYLSRAEKTEMLPHAEFYIRSATKLLRLHNETIEMLARYRRKGEQKVVVQHVNVNDGGKAIVGNVMGGEGGNPNLMEGTP